MDQRRTQKRNQNEWTTMHENEDKIYRMKVKQ